jgi:RHS repeat-associated protein
MRQQAMNAKALIQAKNGNRVVLRRLFVLLALAASMLLLSVPPAIAQSCGGTGNPTSCGGSPGSPSCGCPSTGAGNPIDLISGNKYLEVADFALPGELSVGFTRHYNSISSDAPGFGGGWSHGFESRLTRTESAAANDQKPSATIRLTQGDGRELVFRPLGAPRDGIQRYVASRRSAGILEERIADIDRAYQLRTASAAARAAVGEIRPWIWRWPNGRRIGFDIRGVMHEIADPNGDRLRLTHDANARLVSVTDAAGRSLRFGYWDDAGQTLGRFDSKGTALAGAAQKLRTVGLPDGTAVSYFYDGNGLLSLVRYPDGRELRYSYAKAGSRNVLVKVEDRNRQEIASYAYDESGYAVATQQAGGANAIKVGYRPSPSLKDVTETWITNSRGESTVYRWRNGLTERDAQLIDAYGPGCSTCAESNIRYSYDKFDNITKVERLEEGALKAPGRVISSERYERDQYGRLTAVFRSSASEPEELFERYVYRGVDPLEMPARIERPSVAGGDWHILAFEYNTRGQPVSLRETGYTPSSIAGIAATKIARTTAFSYYEFADAQPGLVGRLKAIDGPLPGANDTIRYEYDARGLLTTVRHPLGATDTYRYDSLGRLEEMVPLDGVAVRLEYDTAGRVAAFFRANLRSAMTYDEHGRIATMADPIGQRFKFGYDGASRLTSITDTDGFRIALDIDPDGRAVARRLLNPDGSISQESFATPEDELLAKELSHSRWSAALSVALRLPGTTQWNSSAEATLAPFFSSLNGTLERDALRIDDERGLSTSYVHDDFKRLVRVASPDSGSITLSYNEANKVVSRASADGRVTEYRYDELGRPIAIVAIGEEVRVQYGRGGRPASISYAAGREEFRYDSFGRITQRIRIIDGHRFTTQYQYDSLGRLSESTLPDGQVLVYRYNQGVAAKPGVLSAVLRRDLLGSTTVISGLNGSDDRFERQTLEFGNGLEFIRELDARGQITRFGTRGVAEIGFSSDTAGRIAAAASPGAGAQAFSYDDAGRVTGAGYRQSGAAMAALGLAYDDAHNVIAKARGNQLERFVIDDYSNRIKYRVDSDGTRTRYSYDAAGRTSEVGTRKYRYDANGYLTHVYDGDRLVGQYSYNAFGERIKKVAYNGNRSSVTYFFYDGAKLTAEADGDGKITQQYVYVEDRPAAVLVGREIFALHTDWRGAPLVATDERQQVVWRADAGLWHEAKVTLARFELNLRGSNQYFDAESGLHYNYHRFFDTQSGRYLTPDPIGQAGGLNLYAFVEGDPVNNVDPLGLQYRPTDSVRGWTLRQKLAYVLTYAAELYPGEVGNALLAMVSPAAIATTTLVFAAWAASHAVGVGFVADAVLAGVAWFFLGSAIVDVLSGLVNASIGISRAQCVRDLQNVGAALSRALGEATAALAASAGAGAASRIGGLVRNILGRAPRTRAPAANPPPTRPPAVPPRISAAQLTSESANSSRFISISRTRPIGRHPNDGVLGEQVARQVLEAEIGGVWRGINNASRNGPDLIRINPVTRTIEHVEVKSTQGTSLAWPSNLAGRFNTWITDAARGTISGQPISRADQDFAREIQRLIQQGYRVEHRVAGVRIPPAGSTGAAGFRLFDWTPTRPTGYGP